MAADPANRIDQDIDTACGATRDKRLVPFVADSVDHRNKNADTKAVESARRGVAITQGAA